MSGRQESARRAKGFTVAELVISLVLVTVTVTTFLTISRTASRLTLHHAYLTHGLSVGEQVTEELLMMSDSDGDLDLGSHTRYFNKDGQEVTADAAVYTVTWEVSRYADVVGVLEIELVVTWQADERPSRVQWMTWRS